MMEFLELPCIAHRAAVFYKIFNGLQKNICENLRLIWQKALGCDLRDEIWLKILANTEKYIKEATGKFTRYDKYMGFISSHLSFTEWACWECKFIHPF